MTEDRLLAVDPRSDIFADRDGLIRAWGTAWADTFGHSAVDALGQSLDLIVPPALRPLHWHGFTRAVRKGKLKRPGATLRVPAVHKDGSILAVVFVGGTIVRGQDGAVEGVKLSFIKRDPEWVCTIYRLVLMSIAAGQSVLAALRRSRGAQACRRGGSGDAAKRAALTVLLGERCGLDRARE